MWTAIYKKKKQEATNNIWGETVVYNHSAGGRIFDDCQFYQCSTLNRWGYPSVCK
jgi:hypothetical protein